MAFCLQPGFRVAVLVGVGLAIFQQITGINTIIYYSPAILRMSGYPSAKAAILAAAIIGVANILITAVAIVLVDRLGRRFLLLLSTAGMARSPGVDRRGVSPEVRRASWCSTRSLATVVSFGIGLGPVMWLLISEIYPTKIRGKAMSLATLSVWGSNWVVAGTFLSLLNHARAGENLLALRLHLRGGLRLLLRLCSGNQGPHAWKRLNTTGGTSERRSRRCQV